VIEKFGCQVMSVGSGSVSPAFTYTAGVYDTSGQPEIITVGLPATVAHSALNHAVDLMRAGVDLSIGRHSDLIRDVDVEFRNVDSKWLHQVMLRTDWFYEGADVPALQMIYPDLENRFQYEEGFNDFFAQPILSGEIIHGTFEDDFWASHDAASSLYRWKFPDSPHTSAYLSETVHTKQEAVTYVSHDHDGDWQLLGDKMADGGGPVLSCLHHPIDEDLTIAELADLPAGWYATREKPGAPWERFEHPPEVPEEDEGNPEQSPLLH
jgi:hypothetical protein